METQSFLVITVVIVKDAKCDRLLDSGIPFPAMSVHTIQHMKSKNTWNPKGAATEIFLLELGAAVPVLSVLSSASSPDWQSCLTQGGALRRWQHQAHGKGPTTQ